MSALLAVTLSGIVLLPFYIGGLIGLTRFFAKRHAEKDDTEHTPNWSVFESITVTLGIFFFAQLIGALIGVFLVMLLQAGVKAVGVESFPAVIADIASIEGDVSKLLEVSALAQFIVILVVEALTAALIIYFVRRRGSLLSSIGIVRPRLSDPLYALIGFGIYFVAYIAILGVLSALIPGLDMDQKQELGFSQSAAGFSLVLIFISLAVLPPLVEELVMRGFLYSGLRRYISFLPAAIVTSFLFAAAHLQGGEGGATIWVAAIDTFVLSMVLVGLRERSKSLWPCVLLHATKNFIAFSVLFIFKI